MQTHWGSIGLRKSNIISYVQSKSLCRLLCASINANRTVWCKLGKSVDGIKGYKFMHGDFIGEKFWTLK